MSRIVREGSNLKIFCLLILIPEESSGKEYETSFEVAFKFFFHKRLKRSNLLIVKESYSGIEIEINFFFFFVTVYPDEEEDLLDKKGRMTKRPSLVNFFFFRFIFDS